LSWFLSRERTREIELIREQAKKTTETVEEFVTSVRLAVEGRINEFQRSCKRVMEKEGELDTLRRRIIEQIARGELPPDERVGLMRLVRQIDWIADWAAEAIRILCEFKLSQIEGPIKQMALEMSTAGRECTSLCEQCISELTDKSVDEALDAADRVERMEEKVDDLYQKARGLFSNIQANEASIGSIILLSQFLDAIENVADRCEDTCDQARVIAVTALKPRKDL
jgi:predicted phosphate transport protein (TIGR00153 family)